jgi:hypothetical protein
LYACALGRYAPHALAHHFFNRLLDIQKMDAPKILTFPSS